LRWHNSYSSYAILIALVVLTFFPVLVMLSISFKDLNQYNLNPMVPSLPLHLENFAIAWKLMARYIVNNLIVVAASVTLVLLFGSFTAFVFARYLFPGKTLLWMVIMGVFAIPNVVILVPSFMLIVQLGLLNSLLAIILPYAAQQSFVILVFSTFFRSLPEEMFEAARMDGAGVLQLYRYLLLPLSRPILSAMAIWQVWWIWNDYVWPSLVLSRPALRTVSLGLVLFHDAMLQPEPGQAMAASVIAALPLVVLFLFSMRTFVAGLTAGAVKM
jgi:ABC-type glycerol-3-phosphate transport system permease component